MGITCVSAAHEVGLILPKNQDVLYKAHDSAWFACRFFGLYDQRRS